MSIVVDFLVDNVSSLSNVVLSGSRHRESLPESRAWKVGLIRLEMNRRGDGEYPTISACGSRDTPEWSLRACYPSSDWSQELVVVMVVGLESIG
jgi:hypothetical protein